MNATQLSDRLLVSLVVLHAPLSHISSSSVRVSLARSKHRPNFHNTIGNNTLVHITSTHSMGRSRPPIPNASLPPSSSKPHCGLPTRYIRGEYRDLNFDVGEGLFI